MASGFFLRKASILERLWGRSIRTISPGAEKITRHSIWPLKRGSIASRLTSRELAFRSDRERTVVQSTTEGTGNGDHEKGDRLRNEAGSDRVYAQGERRIWP